MFRYVAYVKCHDCCSYTQHVFSNGGTEEKAVCVQHEQKACGQSKLPLAWSQGGEEGTEGARKGPRVWGGGRVHLSTIWEVGHGGEEGVLGVEDASLAHVPDLEAGDQSGHQHPCLTPQLN